MSKTLFIPALLIFLLGYSTASLASTYPVLRKMNPFGGSAYFVPNDSAKHTSIVMLHGSEGGSSHYLDAEANILATQGYEVLLFCYFDCKRTVGNRQTLKNIEVGAINEAVKWLRAQPSSNGKVVLYGFSRGAELALLVGSLFSEPSAIIAHAPSDVTFGPFNPNGQLPICWICTKGVGKCTDYLEYRWNFACGSDDPRGLNLSVSAWLVGGKTIPSKQQISIENFKGPILLTAGEKNSVWPSQMTRNIEATLLKAGRRPKVHYFVGANHVFVGKDEIQRREYVLDFLGSI